jgi:hypothetical protein
MDQLIGEKRFYYQDDDQGNLRLFQRRTVVNNGSPYALSVSEDEIEADAGLATRVRVEGSDIREKFDADLMLHYGNVFYQGNMYEINSPDDADHCADVLLDDFGSRIVTRSFSGHADPRIEPNDEIYVSIITPGDGDIKLFTIPSGRI